MKALSFLLPASLALMPALDAVAADFDGTKPFLCAIADVSSCEPNKSCDRESAATVNAPQFFVVDLARKLVSDTGPGSAGRTSKIDHVDHRGGLLMLSGIDAGQGWTANIVEQSGKLTYTVTGDRMVVVAFGACLLQP